jgi:hypothetical protein
VSFIYSVSAVEGVERGPLQVVSRQHAIAHAPMSPSLIEVVSGPTSVGLTWTPVAGAASYGVQSAPSVGGPFASSSFRTSETRMNLPLGASARQFYVIRAETDLPSLASAFGAPRDEAPNSTHPELPAVTVRAGPQAVQPHWLPVTQATRYIVGRQEADGRWRTLSDQNGLRYVDRNVELGESYVYSVQAVNAVAPGSYFLTSPVVLRATNTPPPEGLTVRAGNASVFAEWQPVPGATGYSLFEGPSGANFTSSVCTLLEVNDTRCTVPNLTNGTARWFVVRATINGVEGPSTAVPISATPSAMLPVTPQLNLAGAGAGAIRAQWAAVPTATTYRLYRRQPTTQPMPVGQTSSTSLVDSGLTSGQTYVYAVEAENSNGRSAWSIPVRFVAP